MIERDTEAEARLIPDCIKPEDMAQHRSNVAEWINKAEAAEALKLRMAEQEKLPMLPEIAAAVAVRRLSAESHARVFRSMAARAQQIVERLEAQNALWIERDAKAIAELNRIAGLEGTENR